MPRGVIPNESKGKKHRGMRCLPCSKDARFFLRLLRVDLGDELTCVVDTRPLPVVADLGSGSSFSFEPVTAPNCTSGSIDASSDA